MMRKAALLIIIASIALAGSVANAASSTIRVLGEVRVAGNRVMFADIVADLPEALTREQAHILICTAPQPGQSRTLRGEYLRSRLAQSGIHDVQIPQTVTIVRLSQTVTTGRIRKSITDHLFAIHADKKDSIEIAFKGGLTEIVCPDGDLKIKVDPASGKSLSGRIAIPVTVFVDDEKITRRYIDVEIKSMADMWVVKYPQPKGKILTSDHLEKRRICLTKTRGRPYLSVASILGKRTVRAIAGDTVLVQGMLEQAPVLKKGDVVAILAVRNSLSVRTFGIVHRAGCVGEVVPVINIDTGAKIFARVIDSQSVKVIF